MITQFARARLIGVCESILDALNRLSEWDTLDFDEIPDPSRFGDQHPIIYRSRVNYCGVDCILVVGAKSPLHVGLVLFLLSVSKAVEALIAQLAAYDRYQVRRELETGRAFGRGGFHRSHDLGFYGLLARFRRASRPAVNNKIIVPMLARIYRANDQKFSARAK